MTESIDTQPREIAHREGLRVWAEIDLDCIDANVRALAERAGEAKLLAVVKGNAYGHGAIAVAKAAMAAGAWGLGVVGVEEGEELRRAGIDAPILVLGSASPAMARRAVDLSLRLTIGSREQVEMLSTYARESGRRAIVHLKVETGLNRFGLLPDEAAALAEALRELPAMEVEGVSTHLASVDEGDKTFTFQQYESFLACAQRLPWVPIHHISSTGALLDLPDFALAMVRTGLGVYGYYPGETSHSAPLRPALSLRSRVARVATIGEGEFVGYGRTWTATRRSRIATVMAGYGDGYMRALSSAGIDLVRGQRAPVVGRIAMDMHMVDVSDVPDVALDDEVTLIGAQGETSIDADEVAGLAGTISYEILTGIMARVPRLYTRGGRIVARQDVFGYREL